MLIAFHKPFGVISQFTPDGSKHRTLAGFDFPPAVYPIGRLDADSEGLLLLSDEARWNRRILDPRTGHEREYWVQVEGVPSLEALQRLAGGIINPWAADFTLQNQPSSTSAKGLAARPTDSISQNGA